MKKRLLFISVFIIAAAGFVTGSIFGDGFMALFSDTDRAEMHQVISEPDVRVSDGTVFLFDGMEWSRSGEIAELCSDDAFAGYDPKAVKTDVPEDMRTRTGVPVYRPVYSYSDSSNVSSYSAPAADIQQPAAPPQSEPVSEWSDDFL